jgi:hypothetical protein
MASILLICYFSLPHAFCLSFICLSRSFDKMSCWLKTFTRLLKERQQHLTWLLEEAWPFFIYIHSAILLKTEREEQRQRAAPFEEEERLCCRDSYTHFIIGLISLL